MGQTQLDILSIAIPAAVTIIGFVVTYVSMKKNFRHELRKQKSTIQLDKMTTVPYEVLMFMQEIIDVGKAGKNELPKDFINRMNSIYTTIFSYGSPEAIRILSCMQNENYEMHTAQNMGKKFRIMCYYVLLATHIRYDITGQIISADEWFKMRLNDYAAHKDMIRVENNKLVQELSLDSKFLIR